MSRTRSGTSIQSLVGRDFGPYRLVRRLGVGGMAETYEAIRRGPGDFLQHVCLKLVLPFFRDNEDFSELFEREARLAAKLRHSNIVGVIDFGEYEGVPYMALELVDGADLRVVLDSQDGKRLTPDLVALLGTEIASALEHAHAPRLPRSEGALASDAIVHRDVSPSNVLISRQGEVFLSDFGVAKAVSGTSRKQSAVKGKVPYMSPEQLRAEPLDGRADIFALGVILFEALGGQRPYEGAHDPATIMLTLAGDHPSLRGLAPSAPPGLCDVIESMVHPDRDQRPASATAVIDLLDEYVPSPRARRELAAMVEACRPPKDRISTEDALVDGGSTTGVHHTGSETSFETTAVEGSPPGHRRSKTRLWLTAVAVGVVVVVGAWMARPDGAEVSTIEPDDAGSVVVPPVAAPEDPEPPEPESGSGRDTGKAESSTNDEAAETTSAPPSEAPPATPRVAEPARLTVIVFPWGNVWINGKPRGAAPLKNEAMKPGRYKIAVGHDEPFESKVIRLRSGQRTTLDFDLTD